MKPHPEHQTVPKDRAATLRRSCPMSWSGFILESSDEGYDFHFGVYGLGGDNKRTKNKNSRNPGTKNNNDYYSE